jgi:hypothetical protein
VAQQRVCGLPGGVGNGLLQCLLWIAKAVACNHDITAALGGLSSAYSQGMSSTKPALCIPCKVFVLVNSNLMQRQMY